MSEPVPLLLGLGWFPDRAGGSERYFTDLHRALGGAAPAVVVGPAVTAPAAVASVATHDAPLVHRLIAYARAATRSSGVEVVDAHFAPYAAAALGRRRIRRLPLVSHFHGPWVAEAQATGRRIPVPRVARRIEAIVHRRATTVVVLSERFARVAIDDYGVSPFAVRVVDPGVDLDEFSPGPRAEARARLGLDDDAYVAVTLRRLVPRTGVATLIEAWPSVRERLGTHATLLVGGEGPQRDVVDRGVAGVRFLGRVDQTEARDLYRAADVFLLPSVALEGFGLVALEALACGTPVITTDAAGAAPTVARTGDDVVVAAGDARALADRLVAAGDGSLPLPDPEACRAVASDHDWADVAATHRAIYADAVTGRHRHRVVAMSHCAKLSGAELVLTQIVAASTDVDYHVILFESGPLEDRLIEAGATVEVLDLGTAGGVRRDDLRSARAAVAIPTSAAFVGRLAARLRRLRPDVVHGVSLKAGVLGGLAARAARVPFVWHLHNRLAPDYIPSYALASLRRFVRSVSSAVVAPSSATALTLGSDGRPPVEIVTNPVEPAFFDVAPAPEGPFHAVMPGRLAPVKGQHLFLEAFAIAFAGTDARAIVVGAAMFGEDDYAADLVVIAHRLGIADQVRFPGFAEDVAPHLAAANAVVGASVAPEPWGQVIAEAMAAGRPVIATRGGGADDLVDDGVTGLLVDGTSVQQRADALLRLAGDRDEAVRIGGAARERARPFTAERAAARFGEIYDRVRR